MKSKYQYEWLLWLFLLRTYILILSVKFKFKENYQESVYIEFFYLHYPKIYYTESWLCCSCLQEVKYMLSIIYTENQSSNLNIKIFF